MKSRKIGSFTVKDLWSSNPSNVYFEVHRITQNANGYDHEYIYVSHYKSPMDHGSYNIDAAEYMELNDEDLLKKIKYENMLDNLLFEEDIELINKTFHYDSIYEFFDQFVLEGTTKEEAYEEFKKFEEGFEPECRVNYSYDGFCEELDKGYGNSGCVQIARLLKLKKSIWYDNEYC
jgi:hypothetical protein